MIGRVVAADRAAVRGPGDAYAQVRRSAGREPGLVVLEGGVGGARDNPTITTVPDWP